MDATPTSEKKKKKKCIYLHCLHAERRNKLCNSSVYYYNAYRLSFIQGIPFKCSTIIKSLVDILGFYGRNLFNLKKK